MDTTILTGMSQQQLQAALQQAQAAYLALSMGQQVATASYAMAEGSQTVSYRATDIATLTALIRQLQAALGIATSARRPAYFNFR
jgi:hypothetical protein